MDPNLTLSHDRTQCLSIRNIPSQLSGGSKVFVDAQLALAALAVYPVLQTKSQLPAPTSRAESQVVLSLFWFASVVPAQV